MFIFKKLLKPSLIILLITYSNAQGLGLESGISAPLLWSDEGLNPHAIKFCKEQLEQAVSTSPESLFKDTFVSADTHKDRQEAAQINYVAALNSYTMATRSGPAGPDRKMTGKKKSPELSTKQLCQDLRILSSNQGSGLKSVFASLFGQKGIAPLVTHAGRVVASCALTNPITDLDKLRSRNAAVQRLIDNPTLLAQLEETLKKFSSAQSKSYDLMLNIPKAKPFDKKIHKSKWHYDQYAKYKVLNIQDFAQIPSGFTDTIGKAALNKFIATIATPISLLGVIAYAIQKQSTDDAIKRECKMLCAICLSLAWFVLPRLPELLSKHSQKIDGLLKVTHLNKSKLVNMNLCVEGLISQEPYTGIAIIDMYLNVIMAYLFPAVLCGLSVKSMPRQIAQALSAIGKIIEKTMPTTHRQFNLGQKLDFNTLLASLTGMSARPITENIVGFFPADYQAMVKPCLSIIGLIYLYSFYCTAQKIYNRRFTLAQAKKQLYNLKTMVEQARACENLFFGKSRIVEKLVDEKRGLESFGFSLWPMLHSKTFTDLKDKSPWFNYGAVIASYNYMSKGITVLQNKTTLSEAPINLDQLTEMTSVIGEIDLAVALAKLVLKTKGQKNQFSLAQFLDQPEAALSAQGVWHPLFGQDRAVSNDISCAIDEDGKPNRVQGVLVTGGNGTGKSVCISSVTIAAYLAQCLGVVPATILTLTPFDKFITQMNTFDDPSKEQSLFRAQIRQLGEFIAQIQQYSKEGKKIIVCMDESLSSTKPRYAVGLLGGATQEVLAHGTNYVILFATHLEHLAAKVESLSTGKIVPVQILCKVDKDGHFQSSTFALAPGASEIDSAFSVAQEEWAELFSPDQCKAIIEASKRIFA